jgi:hypothetical protein
LRQSPQVNSEFTCGGLGKPVGGNTELRCTGAETGKLLCAFGSREPRTGCGTHVGEQALPRIGWCKTALHRCRLAVGLLAQFLALDLGIGRTESGALTELLLRGRGGNLVRRTTETGAFEPARFAQHASALGAQCPWGRTQR